MFRRRNIERKTAGWGSQTTVSITTGLPDVHNSFPLLGLLSRMIAFLCRFQHVIFIEQHILEPPLGVHKGLVAKMF